MTKIDAIVLSAHPLRPSAKYVCSDWKCLRTPRPRISSTTTGITYDTFRKMVQLAAYALKATEGPRYRSPNSTLKIKVKIMVRTGTSRPGSMCAKLKGVRY